MINSSIDDKLIGNFMNKLFACLLLIGTTGLASAQVSNFTGLSGAVNLSSVSSRTEVDSQFQLGGDNWGGSVQAAYGLELSSSSVIGFGLNYSLGNSKSGATYDNKVATNTANIKNQYSFYLEPGSLLSDNTLLYGKISVEKGKFAVTSIPASDSFSKSISGTGYGAGLRHMLDKSKFVQVEFMKVGYKTITAPDSTTKIKSSTTLGTIGIGMKF